MQQRIRMRQGISHEDEQILEGLAIQVEEAAAEMRRALVMGTFRVGGPDIARRIQRIRLLSDALSQFTEER